MTRWWGLLAVVACGSPGRDVGDARGSNADARHQGADAADLDASAMAGWSVAGQLALGVREQQTANTLTDGRVLIAGGEDLHGIIAAAELFAPGTNTWTATGSMTTARQGGQSALLADGRVLASGGFVDLSGAPTDTSEVYAPGKGTWSATAGPMHVARVDFTLSKLPAGTWLASGGRDGAGAFYTETAEIFDPTSSTWTATGPMAAERTGHVAVTLRSGKVLVIGGFGGTPGTGSPGVLSSAEVFDATTGKFSSVAAMPSERALALAAMLPDGRVLVTGGVDGGDNVLGTAIIYDPIGNAWTATASMSTPRIEATVTVLDSGRVLVVGGDSSSSTPAVIGSAEIYDAATGRWAPAGVMTVARESHSASLLHSGDVMVAGGYVGGAQILTDTCELFVPGATF